MLLGHCCAAGSSQLQAVLDAGGLAGLLRVARAHRPDQAFAATWGLAQLALHGSQQQVHLLVSSGGVKAISFCLALCTSAGGKRDCEVVAGLGAMLHKGVPAEVLIEAGVREGLKTLAGEGRGGLHMLAREVAQLLGRGRRQ